LIVTTPTDDQAVPIQTINFVIGTDSNAHLIINWDMQVQPIHAEIQYRERQYLLINHAGLETTLNGTMPANQVTPLRHGDEIVIGSTRTVFMV